jgi:hypothetical protein
VCRMRIANKSLACTMHRVRVCGWENLHSYCYASRGDLRVKYSSYNSKFFLWKVGLGWFWYLEDKLIKKKCSLSSNTVEFDTNPQYGH